MQLFTNDATSAAGAFFTLTGYMTTLTNLAKTVLFYVFAYSAVETKTATKPATKTTTKAKATK